MEICFTFPHAFVPGSNPVDNARTLRALLECLISINRAYLKTHTVPTLYRSGVRYGRTVEWEPIPALYARRYGDCKSLSAALIAEYRNLGIEAYPTFRANPNRMTQVDDWHILVETPRGYEDPSKVLGMGRHENGPPQVAGDTFWKRLLG